MSTLFIRELSVEISRVPILETINLQIESSEKVGIIGPNGSGKTTLFNAISGYVPLRSGNILLNENDISELPPYKRAQLGIGRVFQSFGIFRDMTVHENIITALESRQNPLCTFFPWSKTNKSNRLRALEILDEIKLAHKAKEKAAALSGGQMRLLEISRSLAFGAEIFLLDEPTAGVSPKMKGDVISMIRKLQSLGKTVLIIEHDINFIQELCDRIIVLDGGRIIMDDTPAKVRSNPQLQEIYFGS